jgi:mannose-6-phosphate isomerase
MDWRPVGAGDFIFVPAGTIHAIGAGISLIEFQQNSDVTYRLYDYGRPRELHLVDGVAVSNPGPFPDQLIQRLSDSERRTLVDGPHFTFLLSDGDALEDRRRWVLPLEGHARSGGNIAGPGECLLVGANEPIETRGARLLIGATY